MSPCTPTTPFPTNFLATPVHISTLKRNEDATWATWPCSGGRWSLLPGGQCGACALQTFTSLSHSSVSVFPAQALSLYQAHVLSLAHIPRLLMLPGWPRFAAALQPPLMSSFPFTCTGPCWIIHTSFHTTGRLRTSRPQERTWDMSQLPACPSRASAPKHSFGLNLSILTKHLKPREAKHDLCVCLEPVSPPWAPPQCTHPGLNLIPEPFRVGVQGALG